MTHEYDDPVTDEKIDQAIAIVSRLKDASPSAGLDALAATAVEEIFCTCVTDAEEAAEGRKSAIRAALVSAVLQKARALRALDKQDEAARDNPAGLPASGQPHAPLLTRLLHAVLAGGAVNADTAEIGLDTLSARLTGASRAEIAEAVREGVGQGLLHEPVRLPPGALQCHWHLELTTRGREAARASGPGKTNPGA